MPDRWSLADLGHRVATAWRSFWQGPWSSRDPGLPSYLGTGPTASGEAITEWSALNLSAVWAAQQIIAGAVASLPFFVYRRKGRVKERFTDSRLYRVLHDEWNPEMSAMIGRETMQSHVLLWGNAYAEIQRDQSNRVAALWPIEPSRVMPFRETPTGPLRYRVARDSGTSAILEPSELLHIPGLSFDGISGYPVVRKARESLGIAMAAERFGAAFYANGSWFGGALQHPKALGDKAHQHLRESIEARHKGAAKAQGLLILEEGMTWASTTMPLDDAQFLQTRKFQITEIARWFNLPPHKLRDLERATFSNIEEQQLEFVTDSLRPWLVRWEQECNRKLIPPLERNQQFCEHLVDGLLRGNIDKRYAAYAVGRQWGWLSPDDVREMENMNPLPDGQGDVYLVPANMMPADRPMAAPPPVAPAPPPTLAPERSEGVPDYTPILDRVADAEAFLRDEALRLHQVALAELEGRLATDTALREWQAATLGMIAGRLVRRELAQVRKLARDPERATERLEAFYLRFVSDGAAELEPWLARIRPAVPPDLPALLTRWADAARAQCAAALTNGGLAETVRHWEIDREAALARLLMESLNGHA